MLFSKYPKLTLLLLNTLAAVIITVVIGYFVLGALDKYTMHGHSISVPAFQDLTWEEAQQLAKKTICGSSLSIRYTMKKPSPVQFRNNIR